MAVKTAKVDSAIGLGGAVPTNGGEPAIETKHPYVVDFTIQGVSAILFHRWNCEAVEEKANAAKGSKAKKEDNLESYVYRNDAGEICLPGEYIRMAMVMAAKFKQDPRSPRKSAMDLYKAAIFHLTELAGLGHDTWEYLDKRRVTVQRNGVTRVRPAFGPGWEASFQFQCVLPEYVPSNQFLDTLNLAGRVIGVADYRPTYGRFQVVRFELQDA